MSAIKALRAYRYFRAALASFIGFGFLFAGLFQTPSAGRGSDLVWFILVFVFMQFFAYRYYRRTLAAADNERFQERVAQRAAKIRDEERRAGRTKGSIVGKACVHCHRRIVVANDGSRCSGCSGAVHDECKAEHMRNEQMESVKREGAYR